MKIPRPSHATIVAYLALLAAVGGGVAIAKGRDNVGAAELKKPMVREERHLITPADTQGSNSVEVKCRRREQFLSGAGGWDRISSDPAQQPEVVSTRVLRKRKRGKPFGIEVTGTYPPGFENELVAEAVCMPK